MATVNDLQNQSLSWAREFVGETKTAIQTAVDAVSSIGFDPVGYAYVDIKPYVEPPKLVKPTIEYVNFVEPEEPKAPNNIIDPAEIVFKSIPTFNEQAPTFNSPVKPSAIGSFNEQAPEIKVDAEFPAVPAQLTNFNFDAPVIPDRFAPASPIYQIPTFTEIAPTDNIGNISDLYSVFNSGYRSASQEMTANMNSQFDQALLKLNPKYFEQLENIEKKLAEYLEGGTALKPAVENAIYERGRAKLNADYLRAIDSAENDMAKRGFTMPPGALISARLQLRKSMGDNSALLARDISINQANMEQENMKFGLTKSSEIRQAVVGSSIAIMQGAIQINGMALELGKEAVDCVLKTYNANVERFRLSLDAYKTKAAVFETRLKLVSAAIDIYRSEIDALQALTSIDKAKIDIYNSKISSLKTIADVYKTQVESIVSKANLERVKLDVFKIKADVFQTQMQAKNAEWQGFNAELQGEEAKQRVFESKIRQFQSQLSASEAEMKIKVAQLDAQIKRNEGIDRRYEAELRAFNSKVSARAEVAKIALENQRQKAASFQIEAQANMAEADARAKYYSAVNQVAVENARMFSNREIKQAELSLQKASTIASGMQRVGDAYQGAASAAMNGVISLASYTVAATA